MWMAVVNRIAGFFRIHVNPEIPLTNGLIYLSATGLEAEPPKLLRTVIFPGFVGQESEALNRPLPLFFNVPTSALVAVTYTRNVAAGSVVVASTRKLDLDR